MIRSLLADAIVTIHFAWIFYVVLGQLLIVLGMLLGWNWIRNFWFRFTHLSMMLLVAVESMFEIDCPLTVWEKRLRGFGVYDGLQYTENDSFIARWLGEIIFIDGVASNDWRFLVGYLSFAGLVVASYVIAPPRRPVTMATFVAMVHLFIGGTLLATCYGTTPGQLNIQVGILFFVQGLLWYGLQNRREIPPPVESS